MEILILFCLILLNGLFVMSEIALVSARKSRLEYLADKGDKRALNALNLSNNPEIFLSAAQIGITLIAILTGVYSGERFGSYLKPFIEQIEPLKPYAGTIATTIIVIIVTFLSIVFGELIPKRIGLLKAEAISKLVAAPMRIFAKVTHPIVWLLNKTSNGFFKIFRISSSKDETVTEEEIKAIISEGTEAGTIEEEEREIIERVFHLGDRNITSLMTHRSDIVWFDVNDIEAKIREKIIQEPHSVYPICEGDIDNIKGVVSIKDLYVSNDFTLFKNLMKPALFVPDNNTAYQVMEKFKESQIHCCFIVDEYGSVLGMITLNDIMEAIIGDIPQTDDVADYEIVKRDDGSYLVDAQIPFYDFLSCFNRTEWMSESEHEFDTLAGCILHELERIPHTGDTLEWKDFKIEIVDMDGHRIDKVLVTPGKTVTDAMANKNVVS
ncbi:MAG: hemolysin family protein [Bacteroidota bacterium]|nr:HlyC/CorC family transporter [Flavisolibacter sp.]MBD0296681.1 HlyC/CorC family transporter [Flavisolibacter sp.]MBD0374143.1 HlyC/CorC family transporter [Flavisolibacter sp.]MDQ3845406.1 hemolysin family protein [Bacteroidota bacterium]